jgi:hypothetical protein
VSDEQYARLLAAQGGKCPITGDTPKTRRLHVDHRHDSMMVSGLISHRANRFLLHTWATSAMLRRAADYLDGLAYRLIPEAQAVLDEVNASRQDGAP